MPVVAPMKLRMSRRLELLKLTRSGSRDAGLSSGGAFRRCAPAAAADDPRLGARGFDAIADRLLELGCLGDGGAIGRIEFQRPLVLRERAIELILLLEILRLLDVRPRRFFLRALQVNLVLDIVGISLHGLGEVGHRRIPIRDPRRLLAVAEGVSGSAAGGERGQEQKAYESTCHKSAISSPRDVVMRP